MSRRPCTREGIPEINFLIAQCAGHVADLISMVLGDLLRYRPPGRIRRGEHTRLLDTLALQSRADFHG